ncbi:MAG TPA: DUF4230 domain-containing protein [Anaerolineales bacterium]|nr:DUF4230 domain-containing protein [Anaerolineales bacterium]
MKTGNELRAWVLTIGVLLIVGLSAFSIIYIVSRSAQQAQQAVQPVNALTSNLATQVARVLNPTPTILPDPVTIIHGVRDLARLETISYTVEKVITAETGQGPFGFLFGDRLMLVAHGLVVAGVDLEKLNPDDLSVQSGALYVTLPAPEIFITTLDNQKSYIYDRDTGVLRRRDINLETEARQAAEAEIEKAALDDGILEKARLNAENYLYRFLRELGYPEVIFIAPTPTPGN